MTRNPSHENALLRNRLRRIEEAVRACIAALEDDPARSWLTSYLSDTLGSSGEPAARTITTREPAAGTPSDQENPS